MANLGDQLIKKGVLGPEQLQEAETVASSRKLKLQDTIVQLGPGRKWSSVSSDEGLTWSEITDLRYDTGEQFYSPATYARTIRSTVTGKLYCFLNISTDPPVGNGPRYPLQVAEIDEESICLKKETVTIIDDRNPVLDSRHLQLSNFGLLEDRENQTMELYLTRIGERGSGDKVWDADTYRYIIRFFNDRK